MDYFLGEFSEQQFIDHGLDQFISRSDSEWSSISPIIDNQEISFSLFDPVKNPGRSIVVGGILFNEDMEGYADAIALLESENEEGEPEVEEGTYNYVETITITGLSTRQIAIANAIASEKALTDILVYGSILGMSGIDLTAILGQMGIAQPAARAITGALSGLGYATSPAEYISKLQGLLKDYYFEMVKLDMNANPERYNDEWVIDPVTGQPRLRSDYDYWDD